MSLLPFFQWADSTPVSVVIRNSRILFPIVESIHLLALTVLFGTIIVLDIRLMGTGLRRQSLRTVSRAMAPLTFWSLLIMLSSGFLLFLSEALKCYENPPFFFKMGMLFLAIVFQWTVVRHLVKKGGTAGRPASVMAGVLSLILWFSVGAGGRAIGFY